MENDNAIKLLNADLHEEHEAIVYYLTHSWTVAQQYGHQILEIANDEMRHFKWLGHTIAQMGGTPDLSTPNVEAVSDLQSALQNDVELEKHAIGQYQTHIDLIPDSRVQALLERIIADERDHLRQFEELQDLTHGDTPFVSHSWEETEDVAQTLQKAVGLEYQQMMSYLLQSFMEDHQHTIGLDMEERSVDEMRHMGWLGRRMGKMGMQPAFPSVDAHEGIGQGERVEKAQYDAMRRWAQSAMPTLVPTIDRILAHEEYQWSQLSMGD